MFNNRKHQNAKSIMLSLFSRKNFLFLLLPIAIVAILIPTLSFATEVADAQGETLPEKVENAINEITAAALVAAPTAQSEDMENYLCFTPEGASATFSLHKVGIPKAKNTIYYSDDNGDTWKELRADENITIYGPIYIKSYNPDGFNDSWQNEYKFVIDKNNCLSASGSVMSLLDDGQGTISSLSHTTNCFHSLFDGCEGLLSAPKLPATELGKDCYMFMFYGCESLITAPDLPATTLAESCYEDMFENCRNLKTPPELPALKVYKLSYAHMFSGCVSLEKVPDLPATEIDEGCYYDMFCDCDSLVAAQTWLPATTLASNCYANMFEDCDALVKAPYLPAATLAPRCYELMFRNCLSLKEVVVGFSSWNEEGNGSTSNWLSNVPNNKSCFFSCPKILDVSLRDASHVPDEWRIQHWALADVHGYNDYYDGQNHGISITPVLPADPTIEYSRDGSSWSSEAITEKDIGEYKVYYRLSAPEIDETIGESSITITARPGASATFESSSYTKKYGDADPEFEMNFSGLVEGEEPVINKDYTISRDAGEDVLPSNGTYNVYFNWLSPNYTIDPLQTTLTINKADNFKLVADHFSRLDTEDDPAFTAHMEGLKYRDTLENDDYIVSKITTNNPTKFALAPSLTEKGIAKFSQNYNLNSSYAINNNLDVYFNSGGGGEQPEIITPVNSNASTASQTGDMAAIMLICMVVSALFGSAVTFCIMRQAKSRRSKK